MLCVLLVVQFSGIAESAQQAQQFLRSAPDPFRFLRAGLGTRLPCSAPLPFASFTADCRNPATEKCKKFGFAVLDVCCKISAICCTKLTATLQWYPYFYSKSVGLAA